LCSCFQFVYFVTVTAIMGVLLCYRMDRFVIRGSNNELGTTRSPKKGYKQMSLHSLKVSQLFCNVIRIISRDVN